MDAKSNDPKKEKNRKKTKQKTELNKAQLHLNPKIQKYHKEEIKTLSNTLSFSRQKNLPLRENAHKKIKTMHIILVKKTEHNIIIIF